MAAFYSKDNFPDALPDSSNTRSASAPFNPSQAFGASSQGGEGTPAPAAPPPLPSIALPKGGGAVAGMGEKFTANPATGAGTMSVPIPLTPGRRGFGPQLTLGYASSSGNGPFGFGWSLSLASIRRKTARGLPVYGDDPDADVFILAGAEDLVPVPGSEERRGRYLVRRYRPRREGLFARIEAWRAVDTGSVHWRTVSRNNVTSVFGERPDARIFDPDDDTRIFEWLISASHDDKGNAIDYRYVAEDAAGVDTDLASERSRARGAARYLKEIRWGNRVSRLIAPDPAEAGWLFSAVLDYDEDHVRTLAPDAALPADEQHRHVEVSPAPRRPWPARPDPFSSCRSGFEIRQHRRCHRILTFHHFDELGPGPCLVASTDFDYDDFAGDALADEAGGDAERLHAGSSRYGSFLRRVRRHGYVRRAAADGGDGDGDVYLARAMPPLTFDYSRSAIADRAASLPPDALENLPSGIDGVRYQWLDLDGEGLPGILAREGGAWRFAPNRGGGRFAAMHPLPAQPSLFAGAPDEDARFLDLAGDGRLDAVSLSGPLPGFYEREEETGFAAFRPFEQWPRIDFDDPALRMIDLTGDGLPDILISEDFAFTWHRSLGERGYGPGRRVAQPWDENDGPRLVFADGTEALHLADMTGDGLADIVRVRNGEVAYWPNLGYGRFGAKVVMDGSPWFDRPERFDRRRLHLADIDGSGTTDILYLGHDRVSLHFNQSGNRLSPARPLTGLPPIDSASVVATVDLFGTGTACLVWSSPLPGGALGPLRYVDLMADGKPHLLTASRNDLGAETRVRYAPSTRFYLADRAAGRPWISRLPFPVQVVERVETLDRVGRNRFVSRYSYHHGHFDGHEREFGGFARVDQTDTEEMAALAGKAAFSEAHDLFDAQDLPDAQNLDAASHSPPVLTRRWYHTGIHLRAGEIAAHFAGFLRPGETGEYFREPGLGPAELEALLLPDTTLPDGLDAEEARQASRALRGALLREETYALDGTAAEPLPYRVSEHAHAVRCLQRRGDGRHGVFDTHSLETLSFAYDRQTVLVHDGAVIEPGRGGHRPEAEWRLDPRVSHSIVLEIDAYGNALKAVSIGYRRRWRDPGAPAAAQAAQARTHVVLSETEVSQPVDDAGAHRLPTAWQMASYELTGYRPSGPGGLFRARDFLAEKAAGTGGRATVARTADIAFHETPGPDRTRRLMRLTRTLFRADDLSGPLPPGIQGRLGLTFETYTLAHTDALVAEVYGDRLDAGTLAREAALVRDPGGTGVPAGGWWVPSGRVLLSPGRDDDAAREHAHALRHFFLPSRFRDPFHRPGCPTETAVRYDRYDLLTEETVDALGNRVTAGERDPDPDRPLARAGLDYRVMQPFLVMDANRNRSQAVFDAFGMMAATALMGKPEAARAEGDRIAADFLADPTEAQIRRAMADPAGAQAAALLSSATERFVTDLGLAGARGEAATPVAILALSREGHAADTPTGAPGRIRAGIAHMDGFGRRAQVKELERLGGSGQDERRWLCSGWTVFDNKGRPVRQYEPFFSATHRFEFAVRVGVSPIVHYDPTGRVVATVMPDRTWSKIRAGPWRTETWDTGDTVLIDDPADDPDVGGAIARLPAASILPTWHQERRDGGRGEDERIAAERSAIFAATPGIAHADSLGRTVATVRRNRWRDGEGVIGEETVETSTELDILGEPLSVTDALGRVAVRFRHDMTGTRIHQAGMDSGARWALIDAMGASVLAWDSRGQRVRLVQDALRRVIERRLSVDGGEETVIARTVYGETRAAPERANLRGRAVETWDQAGVALSLAFDFKGNPVRTGRRLAATVGQPVDWAGTVRLEETRYVTFARYDAQNRPVQQVPPHADTDAAARHVVQPRHDLAGRLVGIDVWHDRTGDPDARLDPGAEPPAPVGVRSIAYDAKGRRTRIVYANGLESHHAYDPLTFRLARLTTRRPDGTVLQDHACTYDATGNPARIRDGAQDDVFFRNARVSADADYEYDALGRLVSGTGRIHVGQGGGPHPYGPGDAMRSRLPHPLDGAAMARFVERYVYDAAGNLLEMRHAVPAMPEAGWTRRYAYDEPSQLDPDVTGNRLSRTVIGESVETIGGYDAHGSMAAMAHLADLRWDHADRLAMTRRTEAEQADRTFYVYDDGGERVRKVTVNAKGEPRRERIYLSGLEIYRRHGNDPLTRETLHVGDDAGRIALVETRLSGAEPGLERRRVRYQIPNHLGSVTLEVDAAARIVSAQAFSPFGSRTFQAVRGEVERPPRFGFSGQEHDEESGLQRHGLRYYAPWLGRWTSADPAGLADGANLYAYAQNSPLSRVDLNGGQSDWLDYVEDLIDNATAGNYRRFKAKLNIDEIVAVRGNRAGGVAGSPSDPANKQFLDSKTNSATKSNRVGPAPRRRPSTSFAADPQGAANRTLTGPLDEIDEVRAHADDATAAVTPGRRTNASLWGRLRGDPVIADNLAEIGVDLESGTLVNPPDVDQFPSGESVHLSPRDADLDPSTGRVVEGPNTTRARQSYSQRLGRGSKKLGTLGKIAAIAIAGYVFFETGSAYAAAQTANPLANTTDAVVVEETTGGSVGMGLLKDAYEWTPVATFLGLAQLGNEATHAVFRDYIHTRFDPDLAERAIEEGRNPFCAQCHGPGGALDPNNEWNRQNRFGQFPDIEYESSIDPQLLRQWLNEQQ